MSIDFFKIQYLSKAYKTEWKCKIKYYKTFQTARILEKLPFKQKV